MTPGETLREHGVVIVLDFLRVDAVAILREQFEEAAKGKTADPTGRICADREEWDVALRNPQVQGWVEALRPSVRSAFTMAGRRFLPSVHSDYGAFQWHVDSSRPQVKAMYFLTDVGLNDQRMDYVPGTHRENWNFRDYRTTRFSEEQARSYGEPLACIGPAGTLVLFDTNGLHRGNRTMGRVRDTITVVYQE